KALNPRDRVAVLTYAFRYLDHEDTEVAGDAFQEFLNDNLRPGFPDFEYRALAGRLSAGKIAEWLPNPDTPVKPIGPYPALPGPLAAARGTPACSAGCSTPAGGPSSTRTFTACWSATQC